MLGLMGRCIAVGSEMVVLCGYGIFICSLSILYSDGLVDDVEFDVQIGLLA